MLPMDPYLIGICSILNFFCFVMKFELFAVNLKLLHHLCLLLLVLSTFWPILLVFGGFGKIEKSNMTDPKWPPFENLDVIPIVM